MGTSQAAKAASHDCILDIAAARIRRHGIDSLSVAELMREARLTHGGFYRHFDSREHLVAEAAQRALSQGSTWTMSTGQLGGPRRYTKFVDGYLSAWHRDHPESGCGVAGIAADVARSDSSSQYRCSPRRPERMQRADRRRQTTGSATSGALASCGVSSGCADNKSRAAGT